MGDLLVLTKDCGTVGVQECGHVYMKIYACRGMCLYLCIFLHACSGLLNTENVSACVPVSACTCCASVRPDVSVMFCNDRFTPSRDSTNVHTLRLLSPFPLRLSRFFIFSSTRLVCTGDKLSGGVRVYVYL